MYFKQLRNADSKFLCLFNREKSQDALLTRRSGTKELLCSDLWENSLKSLSGRSTWACEDKGGYTKWSDSRDTPITEVPPSLVLTESLKLQLTHTAELACKLSYSLSPNKEQRDLREKNGSLFKQMILKHSEGPCQEEKGKGLRLTFYILWEQWGREWGRERSHKWLTGQSVTYPKTSRRYYMWWL